MPLTGITTVTLAGEPRLPSLHLDLEAVGNWPLPWPEGAGKRHM
jgi:hypothetical protein